MDLPTLNVQAENGRWRHNAAPINQSMFLDSRWICETTAVMSADGFFIFILYPHPQKDGISDNLIQFEAKWRMR